jgi:hypothetical protein
MPNANVIARFVGGNSPAQGPNAVPSITLATTTEQLFAVQSGGTAILAPFPPGQVLGATAAPSFQSGYDGGILKVRAGFKATTGGTSTVIINMYCNQVSTTITSANKIASVTSQSLVTASAGGFLEAVVFWDSIGLKLVGYQNGIFGTGSLVAGAALTNAGVSIAALSNLNFSLTATNGSSVTGTVVALTEFVIETV